MSTITTRAGKGSPLSHAEMDANLTNLNIDKVEAGDLAAYETTVNAASTYIPIANIGSTVQAYSANLSEYATVNPTAAGLALLGDADAAAQRTTLGLGTAATANTGDFQAADVDIPTVAASQVEIETGTETALRSMSPLRIKQAFLAFVAAGVGYVTGSGGTVTQATNKSTAVTLNKLCGQITMNSAALASGVVVEFTFNNSLLAASDCILLTVSSGVANAGTYSFGTRTMASGSVVIGVRNISGGSLSEAITLNFVIIKSVTS